MGRRPPPANWENGYGLSSGALHTQGDANADGDVDGSDFLVWQRQTVAGGLAAPQAVPEPPGLLALALGGVLAAARGSRY